MSSQTNADQVTQRDEGTDNTALSFLKPDTEMTSTREAPAFTAPQTPGFGGADF